jgi:hypothetical protein
LKSRLCEGCARTYDLYCAACAALADEGYLRPAKKEPRRRAPAREPARDEKQLDIDANERRLSSAMAAIGFDVEEPCVEVVIEPPTPTELRRGGSTIRFTRRDRQWIVAPVERLDRDFRRYVDALKCAGATFRNQTKDWTIDLGGARDASYELIRRGFDIQVCRSTAVTRFGGLELAS